MRHKAASATLAGLSDHSFYKKNKSVDITGEAGKWRGRAPPEDDEAKKQDILGKQKYTLQREEQSFERPSRGSISDTKFTHTSALFAGPEKDIKDFCKGTKETPAEASTMAHKQRISAMTLASESATGSNDNFLPKTASPDLKASAVSSDAEWMRWVVLFFACWIMFGNYYAFDNPSALNSQLHPWLTGPEDRPEAFQYRLNLLYSIYSIPNVVLPLLVGQWMDRLGNQFFLLLLSLLSCLGQALFAYGVQQRLFWLALTGRLVFGLGGESLAVSQARIVTEWFAGKELALAIGLNLSIARVGLICNNNASPRIAIKWGVPGALWVGLGSCLLSLLSTFIVVLVDRSAYGKPPVEDDCEEDDAEDKSNDAIIDPEKGNAENIASDPNYSRAKPNLKRNRCSSRTIHPVFWLLVAMCFLFYSAMIPYNNIASDYLQARYYPGDPLSANLAMSLPDMLAMFLVPLMGIWVDRSGRKLVTLVIGCIAFAVGHFGLAVGFGGNSKGSMKTGLAAGGGGLLPLTVLGIGYSTMLTYWACVPKLVRTRRHPLAYGILTSAMNLSVTVVPLLVAFLINMDPTYRQVGLFFSFLGLVALVLAFILILLNRRFDLHLNRRLKIPLPIILDASMLPALATIEEHQEHYYLHHHLHDHQEEVEINSPQSSDDCDSEAVITSSSNIPEGRPEENSFLQADLALVNSASDCSSVVL